MNPPVPRRPPIEKPPPIHETPQGLSTRNEPRSRSGLASVSLTGLFLLALLHTLHVAKPLFLPITVALLLYFLLIPVVRSFKWLRLPEPAGAAIVLMLFTGIVAGGVYQLADPASEWLDKGPSAMRALESKLRPMKQSVEQMGQAKAALEKITEGPETSVKTPQVAVKTDWQVPLLHWTSEFFGQIGATLVLLYFLLGSSDFFTRKLLSVLPSEENRRSAHDILDGVERQLSRFLFHSTVQNAGAGLLFSLGLWGMGMPNPALWGAATVVLQFIPYLGMILVVSMVTIVAALTFDEVWLVALPALYYAGLMWIKGMFITPIFLGGRLELNSVAVLVGLLLWSWIWGVPGTLLAVPLFAALKIVCDHIPRLQPLGQFLSR